MKLREEEMKTKLEQVGPEPANGHYIIFQLPNGRRVTRRFDERSPLKILYLFLEGKFGIKISKLIGPGRNLLMKSQTPIKEEIQNNCIVTVENEDILSSDEDGTDEELGVEDEAKHIDMHELERRRKQALEYLCESKKVIVKRDNIVNTVLLAYRSNLELEHHLLDVELKDEIAVDLQGVTKEMFQLFFAAFSENYLSGNMQKVPNNDHRYHSTDLYRTLGRIISHAYVLCGYWPVQLNKAFVTAALTAQVSEDLILQSFLDMVNEIERRLLESLLRGEATQDDRLKLWGVFSRYNCRHNVENTNARSVLISLGSAVAIYRPYHAVLQMGQGLNTYSNLWTGICEEHVVELFKFAVPDSTKLSQAMKPSYTDDDVDKRIMEDRVVSYLEAWMASLSPLHLSELLVFWTASNVCLPEQTLHVAFNSLQDLARRPTATTCTDTLNLSRLYISQQDFDNDMTIVFSVDCRVMDAL